MNTGKVDVLLGLQWGDEGKGKVVDVLTPKYDVIARFKADQTQVTLWSLKDRNMFCVAFPPVYFREAK